MRVFVVAPIRWIVFPSQSEHTPACHSLSIFSPTGFPQDGWSLYLGWRVSGAFDVGTSICFHGPLPEAYLPSGLRGPRVRRSRKCARTAWLSTPAAALIPYALGVCARSCALRGDVFRKRTSGGHARGIGTALRACSQASTSARSQTTHRGVRAKRRGNCPRCSIS